MFHFSKPARRLRAITLAAGFAAYATFAPGIVSAEPITVVSWGGSYGAAQDAALFNDASKNSGIAINRESGASMSKTCLQVQSGSVTWDLVVTGSGGVASAAAKGCLEKINYNVVDVSDFYPNLYTDYCVGSDVFATVKRWTPIVGQSYKCILPHSPITLPRTRPAPHCGLINGSRRTGRETGQLSMVGSPSGSLSISGRGVNIDSPPTGD